MNNLELFSAIGEAQNEIGWAREEINHLVGSLDKVNGDNSGDDDLLWTIKQQLLITNARYLHRAERALDKVEQSMHEVGTTA